MKLNARKVRDARAPDKLGTYRTYGDGRYGLMLKAHRNRDGSESKTWRQQITRADGKRTNLGLGAVELVTLDEARDMAFANWRAAKRGDEVRRRVKAASIAPTFETVAAAYVERNAAEWRASTATQVRSEVNRYAIPALGTLPIDEVRQRDIVAMMEPLWTAKPTAADRVLGYVHSILSSAVGQELIGANPLDKKALIAAMPSRAGITKGNYASLPYAELPAAVARIVEAPPLRDGVLDRFAKMALLVAILTGLRTQETLRMEWAHIDGDTATIPPEIMKSNQEHRVPLSAQASRLLEGTLSLPWIRKKVGLVFRSRKGKVASKDTLERMLKRLEIAGTPHGMRTTFRVWATEQTEASEELIELCLAHEVGNKVQQAYRRTDQLEQRRALMAQWAEYVFSATDPDKLAEVIGS